MPLALLFHHLLLNMFRVLVHQSSGPCDLLWIYFMCCIWRVISSDVCECFNKRFSVNIGCCGVLWFLSSLVCSVFLIMFPEYILMSCV